MARYTNTHVKLIALLLTTLLLFTQALFAQGPSADWRTIETAHFRVHYPREYEEWSMRAAERLESIRDAVSKEVGFAPPQTVDVLVMNPEAQANGVAWPFLDTPRMVLYAEPPGPEEVIGAYGHWIDLLAVHETTHLVHMLRPSRNPLTRAIERFALPLNPITLRAPRWVLEGYATVIEGRLTGAGRPTSTIRALVLRRWAENGRLPSYGQLNSDRRFLGMSMAYLMGSAYLEWLEQRSGPDSLRNLWSRMTARHRRSFDEAFIGVFGERPDRLYGQFVAELTASAIAIRRGGELHEGALFQETARASGDPAVSPDGKQLAVVIRNLDVPQKLVIWSTAAPEEEEKKYEERVQKILARDPEDVRAVRAKPLPRKAVHSLVMPDGGDIDDPRWMRDGKSILFAHRVRDAEGFLHFDLYRWDFERLTRITHLADVRDADPLPDGRTAIAVRSRFGASQLVNVDLATGAVTPRAEASIDIVVTHPRVSPDGTRIAHVAHRGGHWTLFVNDAAIALPGDPASPEWVSNDELVVTVFSRGFAELYVCHPERESRDLGGRATPGTSIVPPVPP
ncbi:MAG: TolB family protein, partial [Thermoanaerobaculia bacterium]